MDPRLIEYDGHRFRAEGVPIYAVTVMFIAKKARAGDADAIEFCRAFQIVIYDSDGELYYDWQKS